MARTGERRIHTERRVSEKKLTWTDWNSRTQAKRLRIAIGMTGGTIVSVPNKKGALEPAKDPTQLIERVPHLVDGADIKLFPLMNEDSTELEPDNWVKMAQFVAEQQDNFDGILFTHGTDTIAWSASAVQFMLGRQTRIPVVFTGAQLPITEARTDAVINLEDSIATLIAARKRRVNEVMIVADRQVFRGVRSLKISESDFTFVDSPAFPALAKSTANGIEFNTRIDTSTTPRPSTYIYQEPLPKAEPTIDLERDILAIDLMPHYTESFLRKLLVGKGFIKGVVFGSFGAGNTPKRILPVISDLSREGVPVLVTPQRTGFDTAVVY
jgi:L-asparaginase